MISDLAALILMLRQRMNGTATKSLKAVPTDRLYFKLSLLNVALLSRDIEQWLAEVLKKQPAGLVVK